MVGLSIVLEPLRSSDSSSSGGSSSGSSSGCNKKNPQVINKTIMIKSPTNHLTPPPPTPFVADSVFFPVNSFLDSCYLCSQKLSPGKDIYMYKGDRAFCSEECRYRHIYTEEEEGFTKKRSSSERNKIKKKPPPTTSSLPSSAAAPKFRNYHHRHHRNQHYITSISGGI